MLVGRDGTTFLYLMVFGAACEEPDSGKGLLGSTGVCGELQSGINVLEFRFGAGGLADVNGAAVSLLHGGGNTHLAGEGGAQGVPGVVPAAVFEPQANGVDDDIGEEADEQVSVDTPFILVVDRTKPQVSLE